MAVRLDASGEEYTRALALGSQAALTVVCWFRIRVDRNTWSSPFFIDNGQADNWGVQTAEDGVTVGAVMDGSSTAGFAATVDTWYFVCLASSGTTGTLYRRAANASSLSTTAITGVTATNAATLRLGESPWGGEWLNGSLAAVKIWTAHLTQAEIEFEATQYVPNRITNLVAFYPLLKPETTDYSGNARTLSGGTGVAQEDGPPVPWWVTSPRIVLPAAAGGSTVTGSALGAFGFTGTAAGVPRTAGVATASFGFTATGSGVPRVFGVAAASLGFTATANGVDRAIGSAVASFGFSATSTGQPKTPGTATASFGFTAVASGIPRVLGTATGIFGFTATATGVTGAPPVTGSALGVFGFTATAQGQPRTAGTATGAFGFTGTAAGTPRVAGSAVATFGFTTVAAGIRGTAGTAHGSFGFTATATGTGPVRFGTARAATGSVATSKAASMNVPTARGG